MEVVLIYAMECPSGISKITGLWNLCPVFALWGRRGNGAGTISSLARFRTQSPSGYKPTRSNKFDGIAISIHHTTILKRISSTKWGDEAGGSCGKVYNVFSCLMLELIWFWQFRSSDMQ
jgi:hypothetical protein